MVVLALNPRSPSGDAHRIAATPPGGHRFTRLVARIVFRLEMASRLLQHLIVWTPIHNCSADESQHQQHQGTATPPAPSIALYEVIYVDASPQRAPALPKPVARIAYVRRIGLEGPYLVPQGGRWIEVSPEAAFQRAEGLRRLRASTRDQRSEQAAA